MYKFSIFILMLFAATIGAQAQTAGSNAFEGTLNYSMRLADFGDEPIPVTMKFKGQKLSVTTDMGPMGKMESYVNNETKKAVQVIRAMNMAMEIDLAEMEKMEDQHSEQDEKAPVATGNKETINGFKCEQYTLAGDEGTIDMWMTSDIGSDLLNSLLNGTKSLMMGGGGGGKLSKKMAELAAKNLMCVRIVVKEGSSQKALIDYLSHSKSPVSDAEVTPPSDIPIQKMDPSMMMGK